MKLYPLFACLLFFALNASAQSPTCPRVWRGGDTLWTDPAPHIQWLREGQPVPGANDRWLLPPANERASYSVAVRGGVSSAFEFSSEGWQIAGYVFDELHRPVAGATVRRGGFAATTDEKGRFALRVNEPRPADETPVVVTVEKEGYWRNASRQYLHRQATTETRLMLHTQRVTNRVDAAQGGELLYRGFSLRLPPNGVQTESGTPYNGTILLSVEGATPSDPDFGLRMPGGDFAAVDAGGNDVMLYSYGYLSAEMRTEGGQKLELRPEARATLRFYLPYTEAHRPDSVPLWHFNAETAVWEQEGWSVRNGSVYEGQVSHFSSWNCDIPAERATVRGRVVDCEGEPFGWGMVNVGQRVATNDANGDFWSFVPGNVVFDVWTAIDRIEGVSVPPEQETRLRDIAASNRQLVLASWTNEDTLVRIFNYDSQHELEFTIDGGATVFTQKIFSAAFVYDLELKYRPKGTACWNPLPIRDLENDPYDCKMYEEYWILNQISSVKRGSLQPAYLYAPEPIHELTIDRIYWDEVLLKEMLLKQNCIQSVELVSFSEVPLDLRTISQLQALRLYAYNGFDLPDWIGDFRSLKILKISGGDEMIRLNDSIIHLNELRMLDIYAAPKITALPDGFERLQKLEELSLSGLSLTEMPSSIPQLRNLRRLYLSGSERGPFRDSLPSSLIGLTKLEFLGLDGNKLDSLPEFITNFQYLKDLYLQGMDMRKLPDSIGNLKQLYSITALGNRFTELPESFGDLDQLVSLELSANQLSDLPSSFGRLSNLRSVRLSSNLFAHFPESLTQLSSLERLYLNGNQITDLPQSVANLADTLKFLELSGNPIPVERRAAIHAMLPKTTIKWEW